MAAQRGAQALESGDRDGAIAIFRGLAEGDLPDMDRSAMCVNVAILHDQKGDANGALTWYDKGVELESRHRRFAVSELRAGYLAQIGRTRESLDQFLRLLERPDLNLGDRDRIARIVQRLQSHPGR